MDIISNYVSRLFPVLENIYFNFLCGTFLLNWTLKLDIKIIEIIMTMNQISLYSVMVFWF